jgi:hypothetical protein
LPAWPRYSTAGEAIMDFSADGTAKAQRDPWVEEMAKALTPQG